MPICAEAPASLSRTVIRRLSEESAITVPPVQALEGTFEAWWSARPPVAGDVLPDGHAGVEAAHEQPPAVGAAGRPVGERELLGRAGVDHEGEALVAAVVEVAAAKPSTPTLVPLCPEAVAARSDELGPQTARGGD
jgi:hypothetical protein